MEITLVVLAKEKAEEAKEPCTDASHALQATDTLVYKLRGILHGMSMSRDYSTYAEKFEDGMPMAVRDLTFH